jgi:hypothetical protein
MKQLFIVVVLLCGMLKNFAQITNVNAGLWSDNTIWSNNALPVSSDAIVLNFDVTVDIDATCKSLNLNGHKVIVNPGVHLTILGDNSAQQLKVGLLAYYPFNGGAGDESGNGYDLTVMGPLLTANRFGEIQKAYKFNGTTDFMILPKLLKADSLREFTLSAWVKVETLSRSSIISFLSRSPYFCSSYLGLDNTNMRFSTAHQIITAFSQSSCTTNPIQDTIGSPLGKWCHIVLVQRYKTGPTTSYEYSQFYNGNKLKNGGTGFSPIATCFSQGGIIGGNNTRGNYNFNFYQIEGDIDDIRIYDRALSDIEVGLLYQSIE